MGFSKSLLKKKFSKDFVTVFQVKGGTYEEKVRVGIAMRF